MDDVLCYAVCQIAMVMEMAGHGDLLEYVKLRGALGEDKARRMFGQLLSAVEYMHSFNVVHRCAFEHLSRAHVLSSGTTGERGMYKPNTSRLLEQCRSHRRSHG